jgi:DNA-binding transcriptional MerR regulator
VAKGPDAFRTISEAAEELGVPQHVLRFWETKFSFIRPMKRAGGRRFYRRQDIDVLRGVRRLLHEEGYTIKGVQRLHKEHGLKRVLDPDTAGPPMDADYEDERMEGMSGDRGGLLGDGARTRLQSVLDDLENTQARIDALLSGPRSRP